MTGCWGILAEPIQYLLTLRSLGMRTLVEIRMLKSMAHLLDGHVCFKWSRILTLMRHFHYSSSMVVFRLKRLWIIPSNNWGETFVRRCMRLTAIRKRSNPTCLGSQPLIRTPLNWSVVVISRWLRHSLKIYYGNIVLSWKHVSSLALHMTFTHLTVRCLKLLLTGTLRTLVPSVNMNGTNGLCIMTQLVNSQRKVSTRPILGTSH